MTGLIALTYGLIFLLITEKLWFLFFVAVVFAWSADEFEEFSFGFFFRYSPFVLSDWNVFVSYFDDWFSIYFFGDMFRIVFGIVSFVGLDAFDSEGNWFEFIESRY